MGIQHHPLLSLCFLGSLSIFRVRFQNINLISANNIVYRKSLFAGLLNVVSTILIQKALVTTLQEVSISSPEGEFAGLLIEMKLR